MTAEIYCPGCGERFADDVEDPREIGDGQCQGCYGWVSVDTDGDALLVRCGVASAP